MKTRYLLLFLLLPALNWAQPVPCTDDPPAMTSTCEEACIICDIDGFTGRHESNVPGEAPPDFCTFVVHNAQWIAFIAGSENLTVEVSVSNCDMNFGLEVGIYEGIDCSNFRMVSSCFGGTNSPISSGQSRQIATTEPLVIGQYYYLVMDGAFGDNCDWTFTVLEGSTAVDPLTEAPLIEGPTIACPEANSLYSSPGLERATEFSWTLNGVEISTVDSVEIDWPSTGVYELCLTVSNACDEAPVRCQTIAVAPVPTTFLEEIVCEGECFMLNETTELCEAGIYDFNFVTATGCDSMVIVDLTVFEAGETLLNATICEGDSLYVGGQPFFTTDIHTTVLENYLGCDSTIVLDLTTVICEIQGAVSEVPVVCNGEANGQINFSVSNGTPPFSYSWQQLGGMANGIGTISGINTNTNLSNLAVGTYLITINDDFGNDLILIQEVTEPPVLLADLLASDYNGFNLSCHDAADGTLSTLPAGGVPPYTYAWSTGATDQSIAQLEAGTYTVQVTDAAGCLRVFSADLLAPEPLQANVLFSSPDCTGGATGNVEVLSVSGGVPPYAYDLNASGFTATEVYSNLPSGEYQLTVQDANACLVDSVATLVGRVIPLVDVGPDLSVDLAESVTLQAFSSVPMDSVLWQPADGLSCTTCPQPEATPLSTTTYQLAVTSADGCTTIDSLHITVRDVRDVFVPNAFSPNNDGVNDRLMVFGGPEVTRIVNFRVFNRWGDLIYERPELLPNTTTGTWDGRFKGELLGSDVFVWSADIEFIDGRVIPYSGDVLLLP